MGWNDVGGYRLWLRDTQGNQFYYAHLSAFSPLAQNGAEVKAGDVVGFMGNSGDAAGTPYHLHFEIHPLGMLHMGYDGVVSAYPYLVAWRRCRGHRLPGRRGLGAAANATATAPKPGAILLQVSDISTASGLRPGSVARAFVAPVSAEGDGSLVRAFAPPPLARRRTRRLARAALRRLVRRVVALVGEVLVTVAERPLQPASGCGAGDGVEEDADRDSREQQRRVPAGVVVLALHPVRRLAQVLDRAAEVSWMSSSPATRTASGTIPRGPISSL